MTRLLRFLAARSVGVERLWVMWCHGGSLYRQEQMRQRGETFRGPNTSPAIPLATSDAERHNS